MFIGPIFTREAITSPRRFSFFAARALVVLVLLGLTATAWAVIDSAGSLDGPSELSRFASIVFALLSPLVLTVAVLFSALLSAAAVSQEKSRGTLVLLLLTDLRNSELVVGRLIASLTTVLVSTLAVAPFFFIIALLGGIGADQIGRVLSVTVAGSLVAGSLGSTLALWREKTFQTLALTALGLVLWLIAGEVIASGLMGERFGAVDAETAAAYVSPWRAVGSATEPRFGAPPTALESFGVSAAAPLDAASGFLLQAAAAVVALNGAAISLVRVWNPSRETRRGTADAEEPERGEAREPEAVVGRARGQEAAVHSAGGRKREVWDNPILWREVRTWAYGKRVLVVKAAYLVIFALLAYQTVQVATAATASRGQIPQAAAPLTPLLVVSLILVNALSVTSLTGERDGKSLDLLLATDLTPRELIFGKLGGAFWNAREMIALPLGLCGYLAWSGAMTAWQFVLLSIGLIVLDIFSAVLGLHAGMIYFSSRKAIGASIGTLLFLFLGVSTCMRMMLALSDSFENQLASFLGFIAGGGVALFAALAWRNPSSAMGLASMTAPLATFIAITNFLDGKQSPSVIWTVLAFGFFTAAMLVPALSEFDIATAGGRDRDA